jgi:hypothetical protein
MTIRIWIQLPVCGKLELTLRPKKPSSQRINRITMMVHNMRCLLLKDRLKITRSRDRVTVDLPTQQNQDTCCDGEDRHNDTKAVKVKLENCNQPGKDKPNAQQQHS